MPGNEFNHGLAACRRGISLFSEFTDELNHADGLCVEPGRSRSIASS